MNPDKGLIVSVKNVGMPIDRNEYQRKQQAESKACEQLDDILNILATMLGTIVNVITVLIGGSIGLLLNKKLPERYVKIFFQVIGLFTLSLGLTMSVKTTHVLHMVLALITGSLIGESLKLDVWMESLGERLKSKLKIGNEKFTEGILTAFLLFCIGPLTIVGAIDEGIGKGSEPLLVKSLMDGVSSIALASGLGVGVIFSVVPLLIFQGGITLMAMMFGSFFPEMFAVELSAVGGILLIGLGINVLEIKNIKVMNMLPSLIMIVILLWLIPDFGF